ncbi:MAG: phospholipase D family protein [Comamonadaceae bacterium]|nr:MAG: phospholipase D family protein [Comamonadaceae bacterium]
MQRTFPLLSWLRLSRLLALALLIFGAAGCASLPTDVSRPPSSAFAAPEQTVLGQLATQRRTQAGARSDSGFHLLDSVDSAFTSRRALIDNAQRSLDLQYYAIHADASTELLLQAMREAARRGVRVRILLDDFNTVGADAQVLRLAFEKNVEIRLFNPIPGSRGSLIGRLLGSLDDVKRIQKRMHNKLFIADNAWGIAGGRNLGDAYFGDSDKSNFVDLDVLAAGRIVRDMSASFDRYWNNELAYPVQSLVSREDLERLRLDAEKPVAPTAPGGGGGGGIIPAAQAAPLMAVASVLPNMTATAVAAADRASMDLRTVRLMWAPSVLMVDKPDKVGPGDDEVDAGDTLIDGLLALMQQARQDVLIISPYFVPGAEMMKVFGQLRARGVRLRVLTNSLASNDAPAAHAGYARYRKQLLAMGVELHEMRSVPASGVGLAGSGASARGASGMGSGVGGSKSGASRASLHSKAVILDRRLSVIGSMNLDLRSQLQNSEVALLIRGTAVADASARLIEGTIARGAYRLEMGADGLVWRAPPGADFQDETSEPGAGTRLKLLVNVLGPLAPEEML